MKNPTLALAAAALTSITFSAAAKASNDEITLRSGETLKGTILEVGEATVRFEHPVLGEMNLSRDDIAFSELTDRERQRAEDRLAMSARRGDAVEPSPWRLRLVAAGSYASGNTDSINANVNFTARRKTDTSRLTLDTAYYYGQDSGDRSENRFTAGVRHDWLLPESRWFIFADGRLDYDEFQSWEYRLTGHVGVGYELIEPEPLQLNLLAGIGAIKEFNSDNEDVRPEGMFGAEGTWTISARQELGFSSVFYPDFDDFGEFRVVSSLDWSLLLDNDLDLSLTAGFRHEHQSKVSADRRHNDYRFFVGLQMDF